MSVFCVVMCAIDSLWISLLCSLPFSKIPLTEKGLATVKVNPPFVKSFQAIKLGGVFLANRDHLFILILTVGAFGIINTEVGVIGILPYIADHFDISISKAGWLVSLFALTVSLSGPTMPLLFSGINRKKAMLLVLGIFRVK